MGNPDMRTPIAYALGWPQRLQSGVAPLDLFTTARLDFERPDYAKFPCLQLAYDAHRSGGYTTIALNAANEEAVKAFLDGQIRFTEIPQVVEYAMAKALAGTPTLIEDIIVQDRESRVHSLFWIKNKKLSL